LVITPARNEPTPAQYREWQTRRTAIGEQVKALNETGVCYQCRDLETGGSVFGEQSVVIDEPEVRAVLALDPRAPGHTIVVWKPHAHDFTELDDEATARLFIVCRNVARAIRRAIADVERVYQVTMCDGPVNHLHIQLIPRYAGTANGSARLVDTRRPLMNGPQTASAIAAEYRSLAFPESDASAAGSG
jgi:diadenosine tetraphosphate (Ap4A) HIT family hydrolase